MTDLAQELAKIHARYDANRFAGSVAISVSNTSSGQSIRLTSGGVSPLHFIASATKPMLAVAVFRALRSAGLTVETRAHDIDPELMSGIPHAEELTVRHLLSHTSGLYDYWRVHGLKAHRGKQPLGEWAAEHPGWSTDDVVELVRRNPPTSRPGTRVSYCGTNYQFASRILETVAGLSIADALNKIVFLPAGMSDSYLFTHDTLDRFASIAPVLLGTERYNAPRRMASLGGEGAVVATLEDTNRFLEWVSTGDALPHNWHDLTYNERPFVPGMAYGLGVMHGRLPRLLTRWRQTPATAGHFGMTGLAMMQVEGSSWRISSTVNQLAKQTLGTSFYGQVLLAVARNRGGTATGS